MFLQKLFSIPRATFLRFERVSNFTTKDSKSIKKYNFQL